MGKEDGRCWEGYSPVAGVKPYEKGSCEKDMSEVQEVIAMLNKAIEFYDPSQARDESGRWAGGAGEYGSNKSGNSFVTDSQEQMLTSKEGAIKVIEDHHERALKNVTAEDEEPAVSDALDRVDSVMEAIDQARQDQPHKFYEILGKASDKISSISKGLSKSSSKEVSRNADYFETLADAINEIAEVYSNNTYDTWYRKGFEAIKKLDKLIEFYDPSQERDESGKWSGSGSGGGGKTSGKNSKAGGDKKELPASASELIDRHNKKKGSEKLNADDFEISSSGSAALNGRGKAKLIISDVIAGQASAYITSGEAKSLKAYGVKLKGYEKSKDKGYGDGDGNSGYMWDKANIDAVKSQIKSNS